VDFHPADEESPATPAIPSFDSLRNRRRRTAIDLLVPAQSSAPSATVPRAAGGPRPAEWGDLLRLGTRVAWAVAGVPVRMAAWSVREPVRRLQRLLGR
jgi:hypothetical protein